MPNHALITVSDALRHRRTVLDTRWRRISAGQQALLVAAYLRKGETYSDLAIGFAIGTTTVFRYIREALDVRPPGASLAALGRTATHAPDRPARHGTACPREEIT